MIKKLVLLFLFFTLIYKPEYIFIPHSINMFFGLLGVLFYFGEKYKHRYKRHYPDVGNNSISIKKLFSFAVPFVIVSFISILVNFSFDFYYPRYALSLILGYFSFYLTALLFKNIYGRITVEKVTDYFVISECVFLLIGLLSFFSPDLYSLLTSLQKYNEISVEAMDRTEGSRLISLGAQFFTAAIINGLVLIIIGLRFRYCNDSIKTKVLYIIAFVFIAVVGMMMARTTLFGALFGLFFILWGLIPSKKTGTKGIVAMIITFVVGGVLYNSNKNSETFKDYEELTSFGFEMFINYQSGNGFTAKSNNSLFDMYNTLPSDMKTWLIGDARWKEGDHYYKRVDAGYLRGLWYFGIIGLIALFWYYYKVIHYIVYKNRVFYGKGLLPAAVLFTYVLILNYKGPVDLYFLLLPLVFCNSSTNAYEKN